MSACRSAAQRPTLEWVGQARQASSRSASLPRVRWAGRGLGGLVGAGRVLGERIAGGCVCAGARTAAEFPVRAPPAAAAEVSRPDPAQEGIFAVDVDDLVASDVAE